MEGLDRTEEEEKWNSMDGMDDRSTLVQPRVKWGQFLVGRHYSGMSRGCGIEDGLSRRCSWECYAS